MIFYQIQSIIEAYFNFSSVCFQYLRITEEIYSALKNKQPFSDTCVSAVLINDNNITPLTHAKMGMMRSISDNSFKTKGSLINI